jgi:hypothetical protein
MRYQFLIDVDEIELCSFKIVRVVEHNLFKSNSDGIDVIEPFREVCPDDPEQVGSFCPFCSVSCARSISVSATGRWSKLHPRPDGGMPMGILGAGQLKQHHGH